ncbi:MAG: hypothetical protein IJF84_06625 [Thermoguttaceae bacterium]|nr:hypothetical protein [Thermoguttaceae bacterium]
MFTTLSTARRFHVVSFVLVAVCFAAISFGRQSIAKAQVENSETYSSNIDHSESDSHNQDATTSNANLLNWFILFCYGIIFVPVFYLSYTLFFRPYCGDFKKLIDLCKKWGDTYYPDIKSDYFNDSAQLKEIQNTLSSLDPKSPEYKEFKKKNSKTVYRIYYTRFFECWGIFCSKHYRLASALGFIALISTISYLTTTIKFIIDYIIPLIR